MGAVFISVTSQNLLMKVKLVQSAPPGVFTKGEKSYVLWDTYPEAQSSFQ